VLRGGAARPQGDIGSPPVGARGGAWRGARRFAGAGPERLPGGLLERVANRVHPWGLLGGDTVVGGVDGLPGPVAGSNGPTIGPEYTPTCHSKEGGRRAILEPEWPRIAHPPPKGVHAPKLSCCTGGSLHH